MTLFLKSKIRKQIKKIKFYEKELIQAINKYNELVAEYNSLNTFAPIIPAQPQPQEVKEPEQPQEKNKIKTIKTKPETKNTEEVYEL